MSKTKIKTELTREQANSLKSKRILSRVIRATENEIKLTNPTEFFKKLDKPVESRLSRWITETKENTEEMLDAQGYSRIVEIDPNTGKSRWRIIKTWAEFKECMNNGEKAYENYMRLTESRLRREINRKPKLFENFGSDDFISNPNTAAFPTRSEYAPLIGTPFFKQLYLYDYWLMHSKCFWWSNYSGIAKMVVDITRNFVMGNGFSVVFSSEDNEALAQKCDDIWKAYEDRTEIQEEARKWSDDLCRFGENMLRRMPTTKGITHRAFDPSTVWEIVTDPTDISVIAYYHQQYNTQYQIYSTEKYPTSKYVINQLPPEMVIHSKVNITSYEKRGRADLLAPLLYFKYYEDYMQARLIRSKNEAAFIWDVTIKGGDEDVSYYMTNTESMEDVPAGSENVHNDAIERKPLSPILSASAQDNVAMDILSVVAMGTSIPASFFGTMSAHGGSTKAGALVNTEPVVKKMQERQNSMKRLLRKVVIDVMLDSGIDLKSAGVTFEVQMPDILEGDSQQKIESYYAAKDEKVISHRTMSQMVAKELKVQRYDYDNEQSQIEKEASDMMLMPEPDPDLKSGGLTGPVDNGDNLGRDSKSDISKDNRKQ